MDAIKKKMQNLQTATENALARADQLDAEFRAATTLAQKTEETVLRKSLNNYWSWSVTLTFGILFYWGYKNFHIHQCDLDGNVSHSQMAL